MVFSGMGGVRNNNGTLNHIVSSGLYWRVRLAVQIFST
jgi:hypothetical protein